MGRELQKKKNKSGIARVRQKPKSKKNPILANALIAAHWDKTQTLSQNYNRLGLATRLNGQTGGTDKKTTPAGTVPAAGSSLDVKALRKPIQIETREVRIERDPTTGAILRILDDEGDDEPTNANLAPLHDPLNSLDVLDEDEDGRTRATQHHITGRVGKGRKQPGSDFVKQLEADAARPGGKKIRKQSQREQEWCQNLYRKYGQDWSAMARDMKLNVMQQSAGDLKRRITKWLKDGGAEDAQIAND